MAQMRIPEALECLRELLPDEDAVLISDGVYNWDIDNLIEEVRESDLGEDVYDLAINEDGVYWIRPDGRIEDTPTYRVIPKPILWELLEGNKVIVRLEQDPDDYQINGRGYVLADIIPEEHSEDAECGVWNEEGFVYEHAGKVYTVRRRSN